MISPAVSPPREGMGGVNGRLAQALARFDA